MPAKDVVKRYEGNPILTPEDVPYDCRQVYNSSVARTDDGYVMVLRIDQHRPEPYLVLGLARSVDGLNWTVEAEPLMEPEGVEENAVYDPRVTRIDDDYVICYASDTSVGIRLGIAVTKDFKTSPNLTTGTPRCFRRRSADAIVGSTAPLHGSTRPNARMTCG